MREDMDKVIVERPRSGAGWARGARARRFDEDAARGETRAERARRRSKHLNDNLAPLRRFLEQNLGRAWDLVFSEVCARLRLDGTLQRHVRDHVERDLVITDAVLIDGVPHHAPHDWHAGPRPISPRRLYVCPRTGRLLRPRPARLPALRAVVRSIELEGEESYELVDEQWFRVRWARLGPEPVWDALRRQRVSAGERGLRRGERYAAAKRQVGGAELRAIRAALAGRRVSGLTPIPSELADERGVVRYVREPGGWRRAAPAGIRWLERAERRAIQRVATRPAVR